MENRVRIIEKAIDNHIDIKTTEQYLRLLEKGDYYRAFEVRIGAFAKQTGEYKTVCQRCNECGIETIGELVRFGGKAFRKNPNVGAKTAALISDTLADKFGIYNWFSKDKED